MGGFFANQYHDRLRRLRLLSKIARARFGALSTERAQVCQAIAYWENNPEEDRNLTDEDLREIISDAMAEVANAKAKAKITPFAASAPAVIKGGRRP